MLGTIIAGVVTYWSTAIDLLIILIMIIYHYSVLCFQVQFTKLKPICGLRCLYFI